MHVNENMVQGEKEIGNMGRELNGIPATQNTFSLQHIPRMV